MRVLLEEESSAADQQGEGGGRPGRSKDVTVWVIAGSEVKIGPESIPRWGQHFNIVRDACG